jgi:citrate lyase alpha subunit
LVGWQAGGVVQVEPAGTVECFLGAPGELAIGEDAVVVVVVAGSVDEAPSAGGSAIAQSAQGKDLAVSEVALDVGEAAAEADGDSVQRWPPAAAWAVSRWLRPVFVEDGGVGIGGIFAGPGRFRKPGLATRRRRRRTDAISRLGEMRLSG